MQPGRIIWITGAPNSGKSAVSDKLSRILTDMGHAVVRLDGDILRAVLGDTDIQDEQSRSRLLGIYLKLARTLSMQGLFVIVSAVGAIPSIFRQMKHFNNEIQIVLLLTDRESTERWNERCLDIEKSLLIQDSLLKMAEGIAIVERNTISIDLNTLAMTIIEKANIPIMSTSREMLDTESILRILAGERKSIESFWDSYYTTSALIPEESSFAKFCLDFFPTQKHVIYDVGCGDGRDSIFFGTKIRTIGLDISSEAIDRARKRGQHEGSSVIFIKLESLSDLNQVIDQDFFGIIYLRFLLHAIPREEEEHIWNLLACEPSVKIICIEARTTNDPMSGRGIRISRDEKVMGHYRRFIDPAELKRKIVSSGFSIIQFSVSDNLSVKGEDNPDLVRVIAIRD